MTESEDPGNTTLQCSTLAFEPLTAQKETIEEKKYKGAKNVIDCSTSSWIASQLDHSCLDSSVVAT